MRISNQSESPLFQDTAARNTQKILQRLICIDRMIPEMLNTFCANLILPNTPIAPLTTDTVLTIKNRRNVTEIFKSALKSSMQNINTNTQSIESNRSKAHCNPTPNFMDKHPQHLLFFA
eukprot:67035_1